MTPLQATAFAALLVMAVAWFAGIGRLTRHLKKHHPKVHEAMGLEGLSRQARSRLGLMGNDAVRALVRFMWERGDRGLGDPSLSRMTAFMRGLLVAYIAVLLALAGSVIAGRAAG